MSLESEATVKILTSLGARLEEEQKVKHEVIRKNIETTLLSEQGIRLGIGNVGVSDCLRMPCLKEVPRLSSSSLSSLSQLLLQNIESQQNLPHNLLKLRIFQYICHSTNYAEVSNVDINSLMTLEEQNLSKKVSPASSTLLSESTGDHTMVNLVKEEKVVTFTCPVCNNMFKSEHAVNIHIERCLARSNSSRNSDRSGVESSPSSTNNNNSILISATSTAQKVENDTQFVDDWSEVRYEERLNNWRIQQKEMSPNTNEIDSTIPNSNATCQYIWNKLFDYQKLGVNWLWNLYIADCSGGILGDEMGLGKTAQLCVHMNGIARHEIDNSNQNSSTCPKFLIACPATVLMHWTRQFHEWAPELRVIVLHRVMSHANDLSPKTVLKKLKQCINTSPFGLVVIVTYEGLKSFRTPLIDSFRWTAACLDEGQRIKSPYAAITITCKEIPSLHRIILSGTPIQNNLKELWSLFDFIFPGRLGTLNVFEEEFCNPIRIGGFNTASKLQVEIAVKMAIVLQRTIQPYFLRRRKSEIQSLKMPEKTEHILFCRLSAKQKQVYKQIITSSEVRTCIRQRTPSLRAISTLRKLCNHPSLSYRKGKIVWTEEMLTSPGDGLDDDDEGDATSSWSQSGKLLVLSQLLPHWKSGSHKVLVFSQTQAVLGLLEILLSSLQLPFLRLDGSMEVSRRDTIVREFNNNEDIFCLIATTRTGGVGISLTAADRVVIFDPDWNPQIDVQAKERAWRLGQKRQVAVYRLISKGTIEEKIYHRQIFKMMLSNRILDNPRQKRLFSQADVNDLFTLDEIEDSDFELSTDSTLVPEEKESSGDGDDGQNNEKTIVEALCAGSSLSGIFTHKENDGQEDKSRRDQEIEMNASKAVEAAIKHLQCGGDSRKRQKVIISNSRNNEEQSSSQLLQNLRNQNKEPQTQKEETLLNQNAMTLDRLRSILSLRGSLSTTEILEEFPDMPDNYAPIFREMLRKVARFVNNKWEYIGF